MSKFVEFMEDSSLGVEIYQKIAQIWRAGRLSLLQEILQNPSPVDHQRLLEIQQTIFLENMESEDITR